MTLPGANSGVSGAHTECSQLPTGVLPITEPQVEITGCAECGQEAADGYTLMLPLAHWKLEMEGLDWRVVNGRLLCFECAPEGTE